MKRQRWMFVIVLVAVCALLLTAYGIAGAAGGQYADQSMGGLAAPQMKNHHKLQLVEHADTDTVADIAPSGDSVGDVLGFANPVFDAANQKQVGSDNGSCVRT